MQEYETMRSDDYPLRLEGPQETRGIISLELYDLPSCRQIVDCSNRASGWQSATVHSAEERTATAVRSEFRSAESFVPAPDSNLRREFDQKMKRIVRPLIRHSWLSDLTVHRDTHLVRYSPGGFYVPHVDVVPGDHHRYFTVLCYLNEEFEGGSTSFPLLNFSVKPESGKAILFPATYLHCAEPVKSGEKYVLVSWLTGTPPISWL
jgi:prolyl 4-hydroxylase